MISQTLQNCAPRTLQLPWSNWVGWTCKCEAIGLCLPFESGSHMLSSKICLGKYLVDYHCTSVHNLYLCCALYYQIWPLVSFLPSSPLSTLLYPPLLSPLLSSSAKFVWVSVECQNDIEPSSWPLAKLWCCSSPLFSFPLSSCPLLSSVSLHPLSLLCVCQTLFMVLDITTVQRQWVCVSLPVLFLSQGLRAYKEPCNWH